ncbi:hypothetical protein G7046_g2022 [Stylonectria norvegica]|nr:hypothetical protein G7046_g2022 [Stylonectria norvegica]
MYRVKGNLPALFILVSSPKPTIVSRKNVLYSPAKPWQNVLAANEGVSQADELELPSRRDGVSEGVFSKESALRLPMKPLNAYTWARDWTTCPSARCQFTRAQAGTESVWGIV